MIIRSAAAQITYEPRSPYPIYAVERGNRQTLIDASINRIENTVLTGMVEL